MPQDGSNNYQYPPGTPGVPDQTIESEAYNTFLDDLVINDLNIPRPVHRGGTNANNARDARTNLGTEVSGATVTNYDAHVWENGSFKSMNATGGPIGDVGMFFGVCVIFDINAIQLVARQAGAGAGAATYRREKSGDPGVWGPWVNEQTLNNSRYINVEGDTMTGNLIISSDAPSLALDKAADGQQSTIVGSMNGVARWLVELGNSATETGSNVGSDFVISSYKDVTGAINHIPLSIDRASGRTTLMTSQINGDLTVAENTTSGTLYFGSAETNYIFHDGTKFLMTDAVYAESFFANADLAVGANTTTGTVFFGNTGTKSLAYNGTDYSLTGGSLIVFGNVNAAYVNASGYVCRAGVSGGDGANKFNIAHGGAQYLWIDTTNAGQFAYTSDYRIKKDVIDLPSTWDTVKALRPIKYTQAQFSPPSHVQYVAKEVLKARQEADKNPEAKPREVNTDPLYPADDIERWGFVAHELQETLVPSAASGVKDSPDTIQSPNPFTLIAALTKALQEAMARIEALESAG